MRAELYYSCRPGENPSAAAAALENKGYLKAVLLCRSAACKASLMEALSAAFSFPSGFGRNWDALYDCLTSLPDERPGAGCVLLLAEAGFLLADEPESLAAFESVLADARLYLAARGYPLVIIRED